DFRGYQQFVGKELPAGTRLVDFTAARSPDVQPDPFPGSPEGIGHGTRCALAAALAAPEAGLTLIRIDPAAPYQLHVIASYLNGHPLRSESLDRRADQLQEEYDDLTERRDRLLEERRAVLGNFGQDPETVKRRQEYFRKEAELERAEQALRGR